MKTSFENVLFTDESRATLDGPDGRMSGWLLNGTTPQSKIRRQQGGGGVMIWAGIINNQIVGPFRVPDGVKMCAKSYVDFLQKSFLPWYKKQPLALKRKMIFMHDNAPSHAARYTREALTKFGFKEARLMVWPACSPDLNPIENFWSLLKRNVYEDGKQYSSKNCLWEAIQSCAAAVDKDTIKTLTDSMNNRLVKVIGAKGGLRSLLTIKTSMFNARKGCDFNCLLLTYLLYLVYGSLDVSFPLCICVSGLLYAFNKRFRSNNERIFLFIA